MTLRRFLSQHLHDFGKFIERDNWEEDPNRILDTDLSKIRGVDFYRILEQMPLDFDKSCEEALGAIADGARKRYQKKYGNKNRTEKSLNKYQTFISRFITLQSDIAKNAFIENSRFTKVINLQANDFYAFEVYAIAKSQGISPKNAFEQLYK